MCSSGSSGEDHATLHQGSAMSEKIKNISASIHQRLKNSAKRDGRSFQEYFYKYSIERFLYRLSCSHYKDEFVLKGGLMFSGWGIPLRRPTRDIDMHGYMTTTVTDLVAMIKEICLQEVESDGMRYDPESVRGEQIIEATNYPGIRVYITGYLGDALIYLHLDVSFANVITPDEISFNYPIMLGMPGFGLLGYPIETAIAEKLQAMIVLDNINDRMKDFYDIWLLSHKANIEGKTLMEAIQATFKARRTQLPQNLPTALSTEFVQLRESDWKTFLKRSFLRGEDAPAFSLVIETLTQFLWPVMQAANSNMRFSLVWRAGESWQVVRAG
jgi:predicted nucleotidyltransferase component of viral defense system